MEADPVLYLPLIIGLHGHIKKRDVDLPPLLLTKVMVHRELYCMMLYIYYIIEVFEEFSVVPCLGIGKSEQLYIYWQNGIVNI